jgi:hypothetical protein
MLLAILNVRGTITLNRDGHAGELRQPAYASRLLEQNIAEFLVARDIVASRL